MKIHRRLVVVPFVQSQEKKVEVERRSQEER